MSFPSQDGCVLNSGPGGWAFEPLASNLAAALDVDLSETPRRYNYLLLLDPPELPAGCASFIPLEGIRLAADKRLLAETFSRADVPTPRTFLLPDFADVLAHVRAHRESEWCLKYPVGCGASGHRLVTVGDSEPSRWPRPFVVQEFIRLENPQVFRVYGAGGNLFGWVTRRYPEGVKPSPWVAHARGARYVNLGEPPADAVAAARLALTATHLIDAFGCVDLLQRPTGEWVVLEVGTDGLAHHVDRALDDPAFESEIMTRIRNAFWNWVEGKISVAKSVG